MEITAEQAKRVLSVVDAGLSSGLGKQIPGQMCVEAAVCYALDLPHGDDPGCVAPALRALKIQLNDSDWSTKAARAAGLHRLAVAQLGSKGALDEVEFAIRCALLVYKTPAFVQWANSWLAGKDRTRAVAEAAARTAEAAARAARVAWAAEAAAWAAEAAARAARAAAGVAAGVAGAAGAARAARAVAGVAAGVAGAAGAAWAAEAAAGDKALADFAEDVVQILITMGAPGCKFLPLTETAQ